MIPQDGKDWAVAAVIGTEVPPPGSTHGFGDDQVRLAIQAVCNVIRARVHDPRFPNDAVQVVLQPHQFSAVCAQKYWRDAMAGQWYPEHVQACLEEWREPVGRDTALGALWYYSPISMDPLHSIPVWVSGKTEVRVPGLSRDFFRFYQ